MNIKFIKQNRISKNNDYDVELFETLGYNIIEENKYDITILLNKKFNTLSITLILNSLEDLKIKTMKENIDLANYKLLNFKIFNHDENKKIYHLQIKQKSFF